MTAPMSRLFERIQSVARLSRDDTRRLAQDMCADGLRSRPEAEALFDCNVRLGKGDPEWDNEFARAMRDYLLLRTEPEGSLSAENLAWLSGKVFQSDGVRTPGDLTLLVMLIRQADEVPEGFGLTVLKAVCQQMRSDGGATPDLIAKVSAVLAAGGTEAAPWISRAEAAILMDTNDRLQPDMCDPAWALLFARALGNHLLAAAHPRPEAERLALNRRSWLASTNERPGKYVGCLALGFDKGRWFEAISLDAEMAARARMAAVQSAARTPPVAGPGNKSWLQRRLGWSENESPSCALVDFINREAPGLTAGLVAAVR